MRLAWLFEGYVANTSYACWGNVLISVGQARLRKAVRRDADRSPVNLRGGRRPARSKENLFSTTVRIRARSSIECSAHIFDRFNIFFPTYIAHSQRFCQVSYVFNSLIFHNTASK